MVRYNKLVRNNIPNIIKNSGKKCSYRKATKDERHRYLIEKLYEEMVEFSKAQTHEDKVEELADIYQVLASILSEENISVTELAKAKRKKVKEKGSFSKFIILKEVK